MACEPITINSLSPAAFPAARRACASSLLRMDGGEWPFAPSRSRRRRRVKIVADVAHAACRWRGSRRFPVGATGSRSDPIPRKHARPLVVLTLPAAEVADCEPHQVRLATQFPGDQTVLGGVDGVDAAMGVRHRCRHGDRVVEVLGRERAWSSEGMLRPLFLCQSRGGSRG